MPAHAQVEKQTKSWLTYWNGGDTAKERLRTWKLSKTTEQERECRNCGEVYDIEEFWTGTILSYYCDNCRPKRKKKRQQMESQIAQENEETKGKGLVGGIKDKAGSAAKGVVAKPAASMAGKTAESLTKKATEWIGEPEAGEEVAKQVRGATEKMVKGALT